MSAAEKVTAIAALEKEIAELNKVGATLEGACEEGDEAACLEQSKLAAEVGIKQARITQIQNLPVTEPAQEPEPTEEEAPAPTLEAEPAPEVPTTPSWGVASMVGTATGAISSASMPVKAAMGVAAGAVLVTAIRRIRG